MVEGLIGVGMKQDEVAVILGIEQKALRRHFPAEIARGGAKADAKVLQTLFSMATSGQHPAATIFWTKVRRRWSEPRPADESATVTVDLTIRRDGGEPSVTAAPASGEPDVSGGGA